MMMGNPYFLVRNEQAEALMFGILDCWSYSEKETVVNNRVNTLDEDITDKIMLITF